MLQADTNHIKTELELQEALGILQEIKDDTVREMLLKQMRALL